MLVESFVASSLSSGKASAPTNSALKDVGIFLHEYQPQSTFRHGYKKSSSQPNCVSISRGHVFAAQAGKAVVNVYSREKGNQEATVPFPERIHSLEYLESAGILVIGTEGGKLMLWEVGSGRLTISAASHLQAVSCLCITPDGAVILSGSADCSVHIWSLTNLISFSQNSSSQSDGQPSRSPVRTFSNHRQDISALSCGHSAFSTNFAVSASIDQTCYLWRISDCQILRAFLLPALPLCMRLDPADRALYVGYDNGHIHSLDFYKSASSDRLAESLYNSGNLAPIQMTLQSAWKIPTPTTGRANCLTLTYDGTVLLSGHNNGKVLSWDVAKGRFLRDVADFGQPVTNITMLRPEGLLNERREPIAITNVVKPRLELNAVTDNGSCGIPSAYSLHVKLNKASPLSPNNIEEDEFTKEFTSPYFSRELLDEATQSLIATSADFSSANNIPPSLDINLAKLERLEDEKEDLMSTIEGLRSYIERSQQRKRARIEKRNELGLRKRTEWFEAVQRGETGEAKIREWMQGAKEIDIETDEEEVEKEKGDRESQLAGTNGSALKS